MVTSSSPATQIGGIIRTTVTTTTASESTRHVILVDLQDNGVRLVHAQDNGVRLVHALMACSEAVQTSNLTLAEALIKQIGFLAGSQAGAMRKVAMYFAASRGGSSVSLRCKLKSTNLSLIISRCDETCPYLKFAHFTAKQAILFPTNTYLI
ncbi:hypothetical protein Bca4012_044009 [Brassica carinata]|uniref:Uncharacterized protein n=3 Tax=Brassica TaxID=3705 RepID=A0A0D3E8P3_BRAOL|nr:unnamed protein product [Brassica napus]CDY63940.1 BnaC09g53060D [Brassica napus]VDD31274.1 unnamed protein product [Brassica oleracea]